MSQETVPDAQGPIFAGVYDANMPYHIDSYFNEEESASIAFGLLVIQGSADDGALLVDDGTNDPVGVAVHSHRYQQDDVSLDSDGLKPAATFGVIRDGKVAVTFEDAVSPGDTVRVRHGGVGDVGGFRVAAAAGETVPLNGAQVLSSAGAGGVAWVKLNAPLSFGTPDI
jgi:hypothetical protein